MSGSKLLTGAVVVLVIASIIVLVFKRGQPESSDNSNDTTTATNGIRYLPLGDSYTIGQSVSEADRWPTQLARRLGVDGLAVTIVANPSVTGYTTQNLIDQELPMVPKLKPDFVTVLIGVNDYVQGVDAQTFQTRLNYIIDRLEKALKLPTNILLITIPDYGKTPTGARYGDPATSEAGIKAFNAVIEQAAVKHKLPVADVFPVSQGVADDPSLIADDGLHPSGKQYALWTNVIYQALKNSQLLPTTRRGPAAK